MNELSQIEQNFNNFLQYALNVDGKLKTFAFTDRNTPGVPLTQQITCLWITSQSTNTFGYANHLTVSSHNHVITVLNASLVPEGAVVTTNTNITVDNLQYRIVDTVLEDGLWTLTLMKLTHHTH